MLREMDIIDDIARINELLLKRGPFAKAIWFVDCPDVYALFLSKREQYQCQDAPDKIPSHRWFGIPVYDWWTRAEREGDVKPDLPFLRPGCRGIWVEMSDGEHKHFIYHDGLFYSYRESPSLENIKVDLELPAKRAR